MQCYIKSIAAELVLINALSANDVTCDASRVESRERWAARKQTTVHFSHWTLANNIIHCAKHHEVTYASNKDTIDKEEIIEEACER